MPRVGRKELVAFFVLALLWSGNWLVIRIGLADLPPFLFAGVRMAIATALLLPLARGVARPTRPEAGWIALVGFLQIGVSYACVYTAEQWIESGLAALLFGTFPIWIAILGHLLLADDRLTPRTLAAAAFGVAGVAVLEAPALSRAASAAPPGLLAGGVLMLVSAVVSALSAVLIKKHLSRVPAIKNVQGQAIVAAAVLLGASLLFERHAAVRWSPAAGASVAYLGIVGTLVFVGTQWLVPRVPVAVIGAFPVVNTVLALLWGAALAGERVSGRVAAAAALILAGVVLATSGRAPSPSPSPARITGTDPA